MGIPDSGTLALSTIQTEFGGTNPISLSEYYRGGSYVPDIANNDAISTSGAINIGSFYGSRVSYIYPEILNTLSSVSSPSYGSVSTGGGGSMYSILISVYYFEVGFSYQYTGQGGYAYNIFTTDGVWYSLYNIYFTHYTGDNYLTADYKGEWIYIKYPFAYYLSGYTIVSGWNQPQNFRIYGSNDGSSWTHLSEASKDGASYTNNEFRNDFSPITTKYQYFGMVINTLVSVGGNFSATISQWYLRGYQEFVNSDGNVHVGSYSTISTGGGGAKYYVTIYYDTNDSYDGYEVGFSYQYESSELMSYYDYVNQGGYGYNILKPSGTWYSYYNIYGPTYFGNNYLVSDYKGEWIYIKYPWSIYLSGYKIVSKANRPENFRIYGSNDGSSWTHISEASKDGASYTNNEFNNDFAPITTKYQYFGIAINKIDVSTTNWSVHISQWILRGTCVFDTNYVFNPNNR